MIVKCMAQVVNRRNKHKDYLVLFYNFRLNQIRCFKRKEVGVRNLGGRWLKPEAGKVLAYLEDSVDITPDDWNKEDIYDRDDTHRRYRPWEKGAQDFNDLQVSDYTVDQLSDHLDDIGLDSYIEAYEIGVPIEDLFTDCDYKGAPFPTLRTEILPGMEGEYQFYARRKNTPRSKYTPNYRKPRR